MAAQLQEAPGTTGARPLRPPRHTRRLRLIAALTSALPLLAGTAFTVAGVLQSEAGGYFGTSEHRFATPTAALKSDEIDVGSGTARPADPNPDVGELAKVRIAVRPADPGTRLFVGIGPKDEVADFLRGTAHDEFSQARLDPFRATFRTVPGQARAAAPADRPFWVAQSTGTGARTLEWNKTHGAWSVVVMRLDGRPGLDVRASIGLRFGFLYPAGAAGLAAGVLLLAYVVVTRRRPAMG